MTCLSCRPFVELSNRVVSSEFCYGEGSSLLFLDERNKSHPKSAVVKFGSLLFLDERNKWPVLLNYAVDNLSSA